LLIIGCFVERVFACADLRSNPISGDHARQQNWLSFIGLVDLMRFGYQSRKNNAFDARLKQRLFIMRRGLPFQTERCAMKEKWETAKT
jgi:hypothetical protein